MLRQVLVIAAKEILDHLREVRSVLASAMHLLMGPLLVLLVSFSMKSAPAAKAGSVLTGMVSIFVLVAAFVGGMNVAMDVIAGERERKSLLPLLLNPVTRLTIVLGKWLAISLFAVLGVALTLAAFSATFAITKLSSPLFSEPALLCWAVLGLFPLAILAAALQVAISTLCRTAKEAHTYLSFLVFVPMSIGMFFVFFPQGLGAWTAFVPIAGQQAMVQLRMSTGHWPVQQAIALSVATGCLAALALIASGRMLERDDIVYGG